MLPVRLNVFPGNPLVELSVLFENVTSPPVAEIVQGVCVTAPVMITGELLDMVGHAVCAPTCVGATRSAEQTGRATSVAMNRERPERTRSKNRTCRGQKGRGISMK